MLYHSFLMGFKISIHVSRQQIILHNDMSGAQGRRPPKLLLLPFWRQVGSNEALLLV
jgi:hypothetical protein